MLLRRVIDHVKAQNWTAVFLDFVIVVVGVFIGIQVSNWNDARAEAARAAELQERLRDDFSAIAKAARDGEARVASYTQTAEAVYRLLRRSESPQDVKAFGEMIAIAGSSHPAVGAAPTFTEMLSTGDIGLIENRTLRAALVEYHEQALQTQQVWETFLPLFMQHVEALDRYIVWAETNPDTGFPGVAEMDFEALSGRPEIFKRMSRLNGNLQDLYAQQARLAGDVLRELPSDETD